MEIDRAHVVASGFLALLASQIGTRILTFVINLLIARHLTPDAYGLASVQFHLLTTTALFISREGFRRGCLRFGARGGETASGKAGGNGGADGDGAVNDRTVLRLASLTVPLGVVVTTAVCGIAMWRHNAATAAAEASGDSVRQPEVPYYREAIVLHGVAAVLELLAEPFYILASVHLKFGSRVAVEFASTLTKSLVTLGLLSTTTTATTTRNHNNAQPPHQRLLPPALIFSAAQLAMSVVTVISYWSVGLKLLGGPRRGQKQQKQQQQRPAAASGSGSGSQLKRVGSDGRDGGGGGGGWLSSWTPLERHVLATSAIFTLQAVEKLALAEGSKVVLATTESAVNQGVYGLVSNLGSLVVRTLFQPLEEAAFAAFSTWGADAKAAAAAAATAAAAELELQAARLAPLARALSPMVKAVAVLGMLAATFGPSYSYVLLRLVYGVQWSETEAPVVLAAYSVYVLLLALNGIGEAFVHAVLDTRGLQQSNALLLVFSGAHLAACVALVRQYGALGLVVADGANMVMRIAYSAWCIRHFFRPLPYFSLRRDLLPSTATMAAFAAAGAVAAASKRLLILSAAPTAAHGNGGAAAAVMPPRVFLHRAAAHVAVGVVLLAGLMGLMARTERAALRQVLEMRRRRRPQRKGGADGGGSDSGRGEEQASGGGGGGGVGKGGKDQ